MNELGPRPPTRPELPGDPDPLTVQPDEPGAAPVSRGSALVGCGICLGIWIAALVLVAATAIDAAPRSAPDPTVAPSGSVDVRPSPARPSAPLADASGPELSGAPRSLAERLVDSEVRAGSNPAPVGGTPRPRSEAPVPSPAGEIGTAIVGGWAAWCGPTDTQCQRWGGDALLGAMPSFVDGDRPYGVRVCNDAGDCVTVTVVSFCGCGDRHGRPTVIDLSPAAFEQLAGLGDGLVMVTVEWPVS